MFPGAALMRCYRALVVLLGSVLLLLGLLNLALAAGLALRDAWASDDPAARSPTLRAAFPGLSPAEIGALRRETGTQALVYEPFTIFRERTRRGRYLNVHEAGFRFSADQGPWPPDPAAFNVFVFGGSTAFGYGVADAQTFPSRLGVHLAATLPGRSVRVYNFGRAAYYSSQERILFEDLLAQGKLPKLALFLDGLNDSIRDGPAFTGELGEMFEGFERRPLRLLGRALLELPLGRALARLRGPEGGPAPPTRAPAAESALAKRAIDRYLANKALVEAAAGGFGVSAAFVWQPVPTYAFDLSRHPLWNVAAPEGETPLLVRRTRAAYERLAGLARERDLGRSFVWCADEQRGLAGPLYVDSVHYAPVLCDHLAARVAALLRERALLPGA